MRVFLAPFLFQLFLMYTLTCLEQPKYGNIHTIFLTECSMYFEWQTFGVMYSHKRVGQPGPITRVMCCTDEQRAKLKKEYIDLAPTHFAPSYTIHPVTKDVYSAYNKPLAVIDYMEKKYDQIKEDFVLVMDADMLFRLPLIPSELGVKKGLATGAQFGYLKGVANQLAERHIPHVKARQDREGGQPFGRKADQIGGFVVMHKEDLRKMCRDWLKFTEDVRADKHAWNETGDQYAIHPGDKPWISEMYGYVFAAANNDVWHIPDRTSMLYPEYLPVEPPRIIHYGLYYKIDQYEYDKHWFLGFDPLVCPPWDMYAKKPQYGLFPHPPRPSELKSFRQKKKGMAFMKDLLGIETVTTLNVAFCEHHFKHCPPSEQLEKECAIAKQIEQEVQEQYEIMDQIPFGDKDSWCVDIHENCPFWLKNGECTNNPGYMLSHCQMSCGKCRHVLPQHSSTAPNAFDKLTKLSETLGTTQLAEDAGFFKPSGSRENKASPEYASNFNTKSHEAFGISSPRYSEEKKSLSRESSSSTGKGLYEPGIKSSQNFSFKQRCISNSELSATQIGDCVKAAEQGIDYFEQLKLEQTDPNVLSVSRQVNEQTIKKQIDSIADAKFQDSDNRLSAELIVVGASCIIVIIVIRRVKQKKRLNRSD